ncbi:18 kDa seed maturation protein [Oryza sativa Japonica Group]|jgi:hypothetical protein|uniref:Os09g0278000 protein n=2 Tax=Oryza sativa subsp. japonica TaxID=39947 RepID=A0A5S6RCF1_ORYSJ|nr:uncharacterized protein LOC4346597 [Oryza sativa Japonica Group]KAF2915415.1 hypothetical protein DAI22_09g032400 [Oryza sativa Japonica Group]BAD26012.1 hypothetical protein [Oryza sativa Japonica Group]BAF24667.2 Os09g0278000 [Oryza sativa Japonica Group]BAT07203.1 Os09g0278000 [Oryza sativa Japonica Group]|eukprot:NP_001062753.2 Os09g0278000 [Oryza sativa Japonica Group]
MQGGRSASAVEAAKEAAANVGASAWAGKEKTKAVVEATVDKARAPDTAARDAADARKADRIREVEATKRHAMRANAAAYHPSSPAAAPPPPAQAQPVGVGGRAIDSSAAPAPAHTAAGAGVVNSGVAPPGAIAGAGGALGRPAAAAGGDGSAVDAPGGGDVEGHAGGVPVAATEGAGAGYPPAHV